MAIIKLGTATPYSAALIFSVATNVLPGLVFLLCRTTLPAVRRQFLVFPAFTYFAGTLAAQFASVAEGLVSTAYVWLLLYLILFGQLSTWRLSLILLLSIGSLRLHEQMSFLGPVLMAAVWMRRRDLKTQPARLALGFAFLAMLASAAIGTCSVLFPSAPWDRAALMHDLLLLHWIYTPHGGCNLPAALDLAAGFAILACIAVRRIPRAAVVTFAIFCCHPRGSGLLGGLPNRTADAIRGAIQRRLPILPVDDRCAGRAIRAACLQSAYGAAGSSDCHIGVSVTLWHIQATEKWSAFLSHFRSVLASNNGIIPSAVLLNPPGTRGAYLAPLMIWGWTNPDLSVQLSIVWR